MSTYINDEERNMKTTNKDVWGRGSPLTYNCYICWFVVAVSVVLMVKCDLSKCLAHCNIKSFGANNELFILFVVLI